MKGLYAICDLDFLAQRGVDPLRYAVALLEARPAVLQLRAKHASARAALQLLRDLRTPCTQQGTPLFANDRPDLALLAGADGVHVGQDDLCVRDVRRFDAALQVGVSTHSLAQLEEALLQRPNYIALGPVFATGSKQNPEAVVGVNALQAASALARRAAIPLVAIGGIAQHHLPEIAVSVDLVAVIAGLFPTDVARDDPAFWQTVTRTASEYHQALIGR